MKIIWHIFKKDLRRMALPLALWGIAIVMQYFAWRYLHYVESLGRDRPFNFMLVLWGLHLLAAWLLVAYLVHDDSLLSDNAGWRARPISGLRLLAAKIFGLTVMLWLWPSLLTLPWWIDFGFGPAEIGRAIAVNMLGMAVFTGVALLVAVLTQDLARFIAWSIVLAVAAGLTAMLLVAGLHGAADGEVGAAVWLTRASLGGALVLVLMAVVVPMQFLRRRTALARGITLATAMMVTLIAYDWPWSAATMLAQTGLRKFALPKITARVTDTTLGVPADPLRRDAPVAVATEFSIHGVAASERIDWSQVDPAWRINGTAVPTSAVLMSARPDLSMTAENIALGRPAASDVVGKNEWRMKLPGRLTPELRNGGAVLGARYEGSLWRGERGATVPLRNGAGAGDGLRQLHVTEMSPPGQHWTEWNGYQAAAEVSWIETEPLFTPKSILEMLHADSISRHRGNLAVLTNGGKALAENWRDSTYRVGFQGMMVPVGLIGVVSMSSAFDRWWREGDGEQTIHGTDLIVESSKLTTVSFEKVASLDAKATDTAFVPELVIEGNLDVALRRAKAEEKLVLVRVVATPAKNDSVVSTADEPGPAVWRRSRVRELLLARFVCVQVTEADAGRLAKRVGDDGAPRGFVLRADGTEQDRLRDLPEGELIEALRANAEGRTYIDHLREALAARGGDDRNLRFYLMEAMRVRGELSGVLEGIMWAVDHPRSEALDRSEVMDIGFRLLRYVAAYGTGEAALRERRAEAVANLQRDPRDVGAARRLFAITLGLRHEETVWRELPRLLPRENPLWWEYSAIWIGITVSDHRYRDVTTSIDVEKLIAAGPEWVRAQLAQRRALWRNSQPATVADWQRQFVWTGVNCTEALAGSGEADRALAIARAVQRVDGSSNTRGLLASALSRAGSEDLVKRFYAAKNHAP